ncbi:CarboxypepD_reg-like domain-containing protein [Lutibacter oricola]|uniref:CarboxypepD_reg-like domain-containing protein n=1 Tax=Lutibacter oricola TaxID=762486 RepID=A0A1H2R4N5_9FLAO|nr:carboxypeptidase-like regulatory domain-containing protein [Lutibacter oricola]SDW14403.1 CarboxypepD_reg-like domain-containing protein [Lutibacter oricola]
MRFLVVLFLMVSTFSFGQTFEMESLIKENTNGVLQGVVLDNEVSNEPLAFASVTIKETNTTIKTELDGTFSFNLKPGFYTLEFSFIGYDSVVVSKIEVSSNLTTVKNQKLKALEVSSMSSITLSEK